MSLSRLLAGRKSEREVWQYFEYSGNDKTNKCSCLVKVESDGNNKPCELLLVGKNPTNRRLRIIVFYVHFWS